MSKFRLHDGSRVLLLQLLLLLLSVLIRTSAAGLAAAALLLLDAATSTKQSTATTQRRPPMQAQSTNWATNRQQQQWSRQQLQLPQLQMTKTGGGWKLVNGEQLSIAAFKTESSDNLWTWLLHLKRPWSQYVKRSFRAKRQNAEGSMYEGEQNATIKGLQCLLRYLCQEASEIDLPITISMACVFFPY